MSSIIVDNEIGGYMALEHLHSLGHRKIAFIRGRRRWQTARPGGGACATVPKHVAWNSIRSSLWTCRNRETPSQVSKQATKLTEELVKHKRPFTALVAFDDMTAFGAIRALAKLVARPGTLFSDRIR